ncbi:FtsX-like permease family protein [Paenibacillus sp. J22TS3]|uniref:FtsX-like permease family protein n=1 Tax=Paenibacillus sp. J22TS3 TaxID=2807192 RepID=UPI001AFE166D|nr:ABC transporter permease [Paenibacillus sp. J22TS3]GIP23940.1 ABC transporter permease protein YxdM [Paenibacillus sp. J22TS3]
MSFLQFAFNNVRRNARAYFAYFLSSAFMVMIFFTYAMFIYHPVISHTEIGRMVGIGMVIAEYIIFVFSFLFVIYSISTFLKARNKEFGILTILGTSSGQLNKLVLLENMLIGAFSIVVGILCGMVLSKLFLMLCESVVQIGHLPFYWPVKAMLLTSGAFLGLFLVISLFTLIFIRRNRVLELLQGSSKPKKEPKVSILLALIGVVLLGIAVFALLPSKLTENSLMVAAFTGILGTYFFYTQITVPLLRMIKRNRRWVWRGTRLLWISEMSYKIKDNARMLFMVTVVTALACMSVGIVLAENIQINDKFARNPFAASYSVYKDKDIENDLRIYEAEFKKAGISFEKIKTHSLSTYVEGIQKGSSEIISLDEMNRLLETMNLQPIGAIASGEAVLVYSKAQDLPEEYKTLKKVSLSEPVKSEFKVAAHLQTDQYFLYDPVIVVNGETFKQFQKKYSSLKSYTRSTRYFYHVPAWPSSRGGLSLTDPEMVIGSKIDTLNSERMQSGQSENFMSTRGGEYAQNKEVTSLISFVGVFIAAIFSISSASFLYFRLFSDLNQDRKIVHSLSKVGLSMNEMNRSVTLQIAVLFFVPVVIAILQTLLVLSLLGSRFGLGEMMTPVALTGAAFLGVQCIYYWIVRSRYMFQLRKVMV